MDATRAWSATYQPGNRPSLATDPLTALMEAAQTASQTVDNPAGAKAQPTNFADILQALATANRTPVTNGSNVPDGPAAALSLEAGTTATPATSHIGLAGLPEAAASADVPSSTTTMQVQSPPTSISVSRSATSLRVLVTDTGLTAKTPRLQQLAQWRRFLHGFTMQQIADNPTDVRSAKETLPHPFIGSDDRTATQLSAAQATLIPAIPPTVSPIPVASIHPSNKPITQATDAPMTQTSASPTPMRAERVITVSTVTPDISPNKAPLGTTSRSAMPRATQMEIHPAKTIGATLDAALSHSDTMTSISATHVPSSAQAATFAMAPSANIALSTLLTGQSRLTSVNGRGSTESMRGSTRREQPTAGLPLTMNTQPLANSADVSSTNLDGTSSPMMPANKTAARLTMTWQRLNQQHQHNKLTSKSESSTSFTTVEQTTLAASMTQIAQSGAVVETIMPLATKPAPLLGSDGPSTRRSLDGIPGLAQDGQISLHGRSVETGAPQQTVQAVESGKTLGMAGSASAHEKVLDLRDQSVAPTLHNAGPDLSQQSTTTTGPMPNGAGTVHRQGLSQSFAIYQQTEMTRPGSEPGNARRHTSNNAIATPLSTGADNSAAPVINVSSTIIPTTASSHPIDSVQTTTAANLLPSIVQQATLRIRTNGQSEFRLTINPENLGSVTVSIRTVGPQMSIHLAADHPEVVALLRDNVGHLHQAMKHQSGATAQITIGAANNGNGSFGNHNHGGNGFDGFASDSPARQNDGAGSSPSSGFPSSGFGEGGGAAGRHDAPSTWNNPAQQAATRAMPPSPRTLDPAIRSGSSRIHPTRTGHIDTWA